MCECFVFYLHHLIPCKLYKKCAFTLSLSNSGATCLYMDPQGASLEVIPLNKDLQLRLYSCKEQRKEAAFLPHHVSV